MIDFKYQTHKLRLEKTICELQRKKDIDYGRAFDKTFKLFGRDVILIRLYDKFNRYEKLSNSQERLVENESLQDTIVDISCYAILGIMSLTQNYNFEEIYKTSIKGIYKDNGMTEARKCYELLLNNKDSYSTESFCEGLIEICFNTFNYLSKYTYENKG